MTVLTKATDLSKPKPDLIDAPLVGFPYYDPERVVPPRPRRVSTLRWIYEHDWFQSFMTCMSFLTVTMVVTGSVLGVVYYTAVHTTPRYKGYCTIPMELPRDARLQRQMEALKMPLRWSDDDDLTIVASMEEGNAGEAFNNLLERFEIDNNVEKISIFNSGNNVEFIHDFNNNATGIVDQKRCFTMELDPDTVLAPGVFVFSIQRGDAFDVMRVRTELTAVLPPKPHLLNSLSSIFAERCGDKPTYKLQRGEEKKVMGIRRRRSLVKKESHDYLHFAGKHLQEISINNLDELVKYEKSLA